jgi:hypothetical protein
VATLAYPHPVRIVAFDVDAGWARDISADIAKQIAEVADEQRRSLSRTTREFLERHLAREMQPRLADS